MARPAKREKLGSEVFGKAPPPVVELEEKPRARPDRLGRTMLPFWVPLAARKQLRIMAAEIDTTQQDLMIEALNDLFRKYDKPPIA